MSTRLASVLVPTHDHASTLELAVASALAQDVHAIEVIVIGDGVTDDVRTVATQLAQRDDRVRFLDLPKGEHHGEAHRDTAIKAAASNVICYLCDDDLLLPAHVTSMIDILAEADLAQSLNGYFAPDGTFMPHFSDLASAEFRAVLMHDDRNSVSLTGTAHTVEAYLRLPVGWQPTPPGRWPDHVMWQKFLALPGLRARTSDRLTALQFPSHLHGRAKWTPAERLDELQRWATRTADPAQRAAIDDAVQAGLNRAGAGLWVQNFALRDEHDAAQRRIAELSRRVETRERELMRARERLATSEQKLVDTERDAQRAHAIESAMQETRTWRWRNRALRSATLRAIARATRRRRRPRPR